MIFRTQLSLQHERHYGLFMMQVFMYGFKIFSLLIFSLNQTTQNLQCFKLDHN